MLSNLSLAELLTAKFCHDITGPIGAVSNGVEFLKEGDAALVEKANSLIESSSKESIARLLFFRQLYGVCKFGETNIEDLVVLTKDYFASSKTQVSWQNDSKEVFLDSRIAKLLLNLIIISSSALIYGGDLLIIITKKGEKFSLELLASGNKIKIDLEMLELLLNAASPVSISTRNVQIYYCRQLLSELSAKITSEHDDGKIRLTVLV